MFGRSNSRTPVEQRAPVTKPQGPSIPSIVAAGFQVKGDIVCDGDIQLDGRIEGTIKTHTLTIGATGEVPAPLPCEIYCHSLTDPEILSPSLREAGAASLTAFALQVPDELQRGDPGAVRARLTAAVLASLDSVLAEPIASVLLPDAHGRACIETKTTADLPDELGLTGGNIFHGDLSWPFAEDDEPLDTPARRWGVATGHPRILLCGSAARRGGAVSGIGGHNAAMAVLERIGSR